MESFDDLCEQKRFASESAKLVSIRKVDAGELLAESLPPKQMKVLAGWLVVHEEEVYAAWNQAIQGEAFDKIEPLH